MPSLWSSPRARILPLVALSLVLPAATRAQDPRPAPGVPPAAPASQVAPRALSLEEAVRLAESQSEQLQIARAGVTRASGQQMQARSQYLPQLNGTGSYQRTLRTQFSALAGGGGQDSSATPPGPTLDPVCAPNIPAGATPAERAAALAQAESCASDSPLGGIDFSKVGFGARNAWVFGLSFSQNLFSGGRVSGNNAAATAGRRAAEVEVGAQRAQLVLDVAQAYYNAALAQRLVTLADSTLVQTEEVLRQTQVARKVGAQSEFELLRAQVTRDNARPVVIQRRGDRDVALLRLKQLLNLPLEEPVVLTTDIDQPVQADAVVPAAYAGRLDPAAAADTTTDQRAPVRQASEAVRAQEGLLRAARGERWPALQLVSSYQRLFYPTSAFPSWSDFRENWTVGAQMSVPLFTGGRLRGTELVARGNLQEAQARFELARELASLDTRVAINQLQQAQSAWDASAGVVEQAQKAYRIDQIRFREGISTQTDLLQSRILLEQATANRAVAARDLAVARIRLALIRDLPLQLGATSGAAAAGGAGGAGGGAASQGAFGSQRQAQNGGAGAMGAAGSATGGAAGGPQGSGGQP